MGQSVVALMYGISRETEGLFDAEGEPFWYGDYEDDDGPRVAYEGEVVGYSVACSSGQYDDEGDLGESCLVADIKKKHAPHISEARKKWNRFANWALTKRGISLPPAALWLTTDERA